jgi:hypothetical protein
VLSSFRLAGNTLQVLTLLSPTQAGREWPLLESGHLNSDKGSPTYLLGIGSSTLAEEAQPDAFTPRPGLVVTVL